MSNPIFGPMIIGKYGKWRKILEPKIKKDYISLNTDYNQKNYRIEDIEIYLIYRLTNECGAYCLISVDKNIDLDQQAKKIFYKNNGIEKNWWE